MAPTKRSRFVVRARRLLVWLAPALALAALAGCRHHRSAYRPIFASPAPAVIGAPAPCPSGDCGGGAVIAPEPAFSDPASVTSPPPSPLGSEPINRAGGGAIGNEPSFEPPAGNGLGTSNTPTLEPPRASLRETRSLGTQAPRRKTSGARRSLLRRNVQTYVNDPVDFFNPPRAERPWRYVVVHHSAYESGGLAQIDHDHRERLGTAGCGYHFVIGNGTESPDGQIEVARRWAEQKGGAHCRDCADPAANEYGIGICLVGNLDDQPPTPKQIEAARALVAYLQDRYEIPTQNLLDHQSVARTAAACPGRHFPADQILGSLDRPMASR